MAYDFGMSQASRSAIVALFKYGNDEIAYLSQRRSSAWHVQDQGCQNRIPPSDEMMFFAQFVLHTVVCLLFVSMECFLTVALLITIARIASMQSKAIPHIRCRRAAPCFCPLQLWPDQKQCLNAGPRSQSYRRLCEA